MKTLPIPAQFYIVTLFGLATAAGVGSAFIILPRPDYVLATLVIAGLIAILDMYPIIMGPIVDQNHTEIIISTSIKVAAILLFNPAVTIFATLLGSTISELRHNRPYFKKLFNVASHTTTYTVIPFVYWLVQGTGTGIVDTPRNFAALGALAVTDLVFNSLAVSMVVALATRTSLSYVWSQNFKPVILHDLSMVPIGAFIALLWKVSPWAALFAVVPMWLARYSYDMVRRLERQTLQALMVMARMLDERDEHTHHHCELVAQHAEEIALALDLILGEVETVKRAAYLHDIGKIAMSNEILFKPDSLTPAEREQAKKHAPLGAELLSQFPVFQRGATYVRHHHERWDGGGYPDGLAGESIPLGARIVAVSDSYQAMIEDRPYRKAFPESVALAEMHDKAGTQFDPRVVKALFTAKHHPYPPTPKPAPEIAIPLVQPAERMTQSVPETSPVALSQAKA
jgi:putative nucleotidyltransferase with HDIG domain